MGNTYHNTSAAAGPLDQKYSDLGTDATRLLARRLLRKVIPPLIATHYLRLESPVIHITIGGSAEAIGGEDRGLSANPEPQIYLPHTVALA